MKLWTITSRVYRSSRAVSEAGEEVSESLLVSVLLNGLSGEYEAFITTRNYGKEESFEKVAECLRTHCDYQRSKAKMRGGDKMKETSSTCAAYNS